ncbi:MAG: single-stranded-DNA-specific exonuclease RecJ [Microgenomates group bacterium]
MKIKYKEEIKINTPINDQEIIDLLIKNRKIANKEEFLNPTSPLKISLTDFGFKRQWQKTFNLLKKIKENGQMIVVYTDYDADGITGGAILWETLYLLGFKVMPYVPHRQYEGYGFSIKGIDTVKKLYNPALIISVDHGITAKEKIAYAKSLGIKIIVTDHHLKPEKLPTEAEAIFHIPELSGAGVAYFFAKEIFNSFHHMVERRPGVSLQNYFITDYLALASIGTIADLVPLIGPSRSLVKYGLEVFDKVKRHGLKHIFKEAGIEGKKITPYEIGFIIAPRINAVGRLEHAIDALRLLCTTNEKRAHDLADKAGSKNVQRQELVEKSVEEAKKNLKTQISKFKTLPKIIILSSDKWHEGIMGLIAAKIAEEFYRPTIVLTKTDGFYKGSARSIPGFDITNFLRSLKKYLIDVGGHKQAAGFTLEKNQLNNFCAAAQELSSSLIKEKDLERKIEVDLKIPISKISLSLVKALEKLQPFGAGNPQPTFYSRGKIVDAKIFGKKNEHLKIWLSPTPPAKEETQYLELIAFGQGEKFKELSRDQITDVVYSLEINRWGNKEKVRGKIINLFIK